MQESQQLGFIARGFFTSSPDGSQAMLTRLSVKHNSNERISAPMTL
jgi:hypothetical protein